MDEKCLQGQIVRAVEQRCAHLHADPLLAQKVILAANRKESKPVRGKMKFGVVLALILALMTTTAVAAALLTGMELIEQEAVPIAQSNDGEVRPEENFSYEELKSIIATAEENGVYLDDDTSVMRALRAGEGYSEEETIMALCREAFGGLYYEWTVEEQYFFEEMMVKIGWSTVNDIILPGKNDMPLADARALARKILRDNYGADIPLDDPAKYRCQEEFYAQGDDQVGLNWAYSFLPRTVDGAAYYVSFDNKGGSVEHRVEPWVWGEYNEQTLTDRVDSVYNYRYRGSGMMAWEYDAWHAFGQKLAGAKHSDKWNAEYDGYAASVYLLPGENDLTKKQAREIAFTDAGVNDYTGVTELLLGKADQRIWKISFETSALTGERQVLSYEIDSQTRQILRKDDLAAEANWARYMLDETYRVNAPEKQDILDQDKAVELAVAALHEKFGDNTIPYTDEACYTIEARYNNNDGSYHFMFNPKTMEYGRASVEINGNGRVDIWFANAPGLDGDKLFDRYLDVYGTDMDWTQDMWVKFGQEMAKYEPTTFEGKLFKQTTYLPESAVKISREKAMDIAYLESGKCDINRIVLIDAEPNPIWKVRVSTWPTTQLYEIDAMTGEVLDKEYYFIQMSNFDHVMKMYTLRRDYMPAALKEFGIERIAMELCAKDQIKAFENGSPDTLMNGSYAISVEGMTVRFQAIDSRDTSYVVTVGENAMSVEVEVIPAAAPDGSLTSEERAAVIKQYGDDERFWPLEVRYEYYRDHGDICSIPVEGEMTQEEAQAHAMKLLVAQVGQEAVNALGEVKVGCAFNRFHNEGNQIRWTFYFVNPDDVTKGWKVTFAIWNGVPEENGDIKDINDRTNG